MSVKAMIQDNTRCIGCRACMVACKEWNDLGADEDSNFFAGDGYQNPRDLDEHNYTLITYREEPAYGEWVFGRQLCMHCTEPACVSVCPTGALQKLANGPVELTEWRCIGCRYCIQACPFVIPKTNFDSPFPKIHKCTMCSDRLAADLEPACATVCPTHAIEFGDRDDMLAESKRRIADSPGRYVPHVYGEKEAGGTNVFHLSAVPFENIGYQTGLPNEPMPDLTHKSMRFVPRIFFGLLSVFGVTAWIVRRRMRRMGIAEDL
ncbi:MAG: 4Fe-4S dicluster domain-containing protein [Deltaproteobacteria bacterium]|nr:4Fe-4S dicluster domain-containing protein [Deltaproteobacteria bacterium]